MRAARRARKPTRDCVSPAKPARHNVASWGNRLATRRGGAVPTRTLTLGEVCRAGFAGRGTPSVPFHRAASSLSVPDPRRSLGSVS